MRASASPQLLTLLPIDRARGVPLHRQIYDGLRRAILAGLLRPGQRVPATRVLAVELEVSRLPVLAAYEQLLHEGYLEGRVGSGTFVSGALPEERLHAVPGGHGQAGRPAPRVGRPAIGSDERPATERPASSPSEQLHAPVGQAFRPARAPSPGAARDDGGLRPFRVSLPALDEFPRDLWAKLVARHARALGPEHMAYGDPAGLRVLRAAIAEHLRTARAVRCEAEQVLVVSGSQAALRLCATVLLGRGDRVAVEEPGYPGAHAALGTTGAELVPVGIDGEGIDVAALDALGPRVRAAYVTPSHQYPLGVSMSAGRRLALLDWARRRDAWIVEDDYDSEFRYVSRPLGALQGTDGHGRVVYVGTFSKVLFPALRVGYLVVPPALWERFTAARDALDIFSSTLYQLVLADFIAEGHFARHLRRMRGVYLKRREALLAGLAAHCADTLEVLNADAGLHVATTLPAGTDDVAVVRRLAARRLDATALSTCYLGAERRSGLLLGFGGFPERKVARATRELGEVLRGGPSVGP